MNETGPASALSDATGAGLFAGREQATAALVLADGTAFLGQGLGATGRSVGEVCFNTSVTGYQEILTDPSYAGQIITFTFPHVGNVGANPEDIETATPAARGLVLRAEVTAPSNWRAAQHLDAWLKSHNLIGIAGIDTRALTRRIRDLGAPEALVVGPRIEFLWRQSISETIGGGTSEIMRGVIAAQGLGLPIR